MVVDKKSRKIICTNFSHGKCHDFTLFKQSKLSSTPTTLIQANSGYQGVADYHANSELPKKSTKMNPLTKLDKLTNKKLAAERIINENVIGCVKRFRILSSVYRNHRKRFGLRFNLISAFYN